MNIISNHRLFFFSNVVKIVSMSKYLIIQKKFSNLKKVNSYVSRLAKTPVERNYWKNKLNRLNYLNWLGKKLNFKNKEDWYKKLTSRDLRKNHGGALFKNYYKSSKYNILKELFPILNRTHGSILQCLEATGRNWIIKKNI